MKADKNLQEQVDHGTCELPLKFYELNTEIYSEYPLHWHDEMEILLIARGSILVTVNQDIIQGNAGNFILIGKKMLHSISKNHADPEVLYFTSLLFNLRMLEGCAEDFCQKNLAGPLMEGRMEFPLLIKPEHKNYSNMKECFLRLFSVYQTKELFFEYKLKGILYEMFAEFQKCGDFRLVRKNTGKTTDTIIKALDFIENNYSEEISVSALASLIGYNESYFMKVFKKHTGSTVINFINDFRLRKAAEFLLNSSLTVEEIAFCTGFESASYFIKRFRGKYKTTPKEFRKTQA